MHSQRARTRRIGAPRAAALLAGALTLVLLGGCGQPPWEQEATTSPSASASATPSESPSETPSPSPSVTQIVNDLASGSAARTLSAGAATIEVQYWSDLSMADWTASASKPVSMSATATIDGEVSVYLSRLRVVTVVRDAAGEVLAGPDEFVDASSVQPGYTMSDPFSYATTVIVPALDENAASVELTFVYEVLIATTPDSTAYAKQTATDVLTIAIAPTE